MMICKMDEGRLMKHIIESSVNGLVDVDPSESVTRIENVLKKGQKKVNKTNGRCIWKDVIFAPSSTGKA